MPRSSRAQDLDRNGVSSPEALYNIIYFGKGKMPGYGTDCTPKVGDASRANLCLLDS